MGLWKKVNKNYYFKYFNKFNLNYRTLLGCLALVGIVLLKIYFNYASSKEVVIIHYPSQSSSTHTPPHEKPAQYHKYSFNPVRCPKCKDDSRSEVLDPTNWIPDEPFVYLRTFGGLGNQLFQYACAYTLAKKNQLQLLIYADSESGSEDDSTVKPESFEFALQFYHIPLPLYDREKIFIIEEFIEKSENESRVQNLSDEDILTQSYQINDKIIRIFDYSQSEYFFLPYRDEIRRFFKPRMLNSTRIIKWMNEIQKIDQTHDSVCVHIRRGDFLYTSDRLVNTTFYTTAMEDIHQRLEKIGKAPAFFLFSDDITDAEDNFEELLTLEDFEQLKLVSDSETTIVEDMYLMSQCRHNILSGSTFGWWGAYLNEYPDQIVIASHLKQEATDDPYTSFVHRNLYYPPSWFVREADYANR